MNPLKATCRLFARLRLLRRQCLRAKENRNKRVKAMDRTDERTSYEAVGDIRYSIRYFHLQRRFFRKIEGLFRLVYVVAGSSAFAGYLSKDPKLAGIAALVTAIVTALDIVWSPGSKAQTCFEIVRRYTDLDRKSNKLTLEELDDEIHNIRNYTEAPAIEALRIPALNDSLLERGLPSEVHPATWWQKFVAALA